MKFTPIPTFHKAERSNTFPIILRIEEYRMKDSFYYFFSGIPQVLGGILYQSFSGTGTVMRTQSLVIASNCGGTLSFNP
jgi:hypothetical protein